MKKRNVKTKFSLNKETVSRLNDSRLDAIMGGAGPRTSKGRTCSATRCDCPQSKISVCECVEK